MPDVSNPLLALRLTVDYPTRPGVLRDLRLEMRVGEVLGLVGRSGSGKSTIALSILRLLDARGGVSRGQVLFEGRDLLALSERQMRALRGRHLSLVLQSPLSALNPAMRLGAQLEEAWRVHARGSRAECRASIGRALEEVSLPFDANFLARYPDQVSVGQAQRVLIAMAVIHRPALLIADEPTSALDLITQAEILDLFRALNRHQGVGILYISHDLASVASLCDRIAILQEGEVVECAAVQQIFAAPRHPYTARLVAALPRLFFDRGAAVE